MSASKPGMASTEKRIRTLSAKGAGIYYTTKQDLFEMVETAWLKTQMCLKKLFMFEQGTETFLEAKKSLTLCFNNYCKHANNYLVYLKQVNTEDSRHVYDSYTFVLRDNKIVCENALKETPLPEKSEPKVRSHKSSVASVASSKASKLSSVLVKSRAKAEAARAKVLFAAKEAEIRKMQALLDEQKVLSNAKTARITAELEADLTLISHEKEAAAAEAEADALQFEENLSRKSVISSHADTRARTEQYVRQLTPTHDDNVINNFSHDDNADVDIPTPIKRLSFVPSPKSEIPKRDVPSISSGFPETAQELAAVTNLDANAPPFKPGMAPNTTAANPGAYPPNSVTSDLTRFLLKKDLLFSRLTAFNDKPEMYAVWKASFGNIMRELSVTAMEEMDLLVKWLGPESSRQAHSIRASNVSDPSKGVTRLWERLDERYGAPELVESALSSKLQNFPKLTNRDSNKLYELADILGEIEAVKDDAKYQSLLAYYDSSSGVIPIVNKLPYNIQEKWTTRAAGYKKFHNVPFPPFSVFVDFIREMSKIRNDPGFAYNLPPASRQDRPPPRFSTSRPPITVRKTDVSDKESIQHEVCPIHKSGHMLNQCRGFRFKSLNQRKRILSEHKICYKCCDSRNHTSRDCTRSIKCYVCGSNGHPTALHAYNEWTPRKPPYVPPKDHGGESNEGVQSTPSVPVSSKCTEICGLGFTGKSCAKIILVRVYPKGREENAITTYAIFDDQSNKSLAKSELFSSIDIRGKEIQYTLSSCAGSMTKSGRIAENCVVESLDGKTRFSLPPMFECNDIPDIREEIPTRDIARMYPHLYDIQEYIPTLSESRTLLLIGRDLSDAHHVLDQRTGPSNTPYAQQLRLGWVIVGETCIGKIHKNDTVNVNKTCLTNNGRPSVFKPCENKFDVRESFDEMGASVFMKTPDDNKIGKSVEDRAFLRLMDRECFKDDSGNWVAPLPFRSPRPTLPNNKLQALTRARALHRDLSKNAVKMQHMLTFMQNVFDSGHAELAPPLDENEESWYLPVFGVYHRRKQDSIRAVFDSSAEYEGLSLNSVLLSGPDLTNNLLDVILRFRVEPIAVTGDIQQMFHSFLVREDHRNYLRFLWYRNNDPSEDLVDYRMRVHVFGNRPSPAVANYCLHRTAQDGEETFGSDVRAFVESNFYVDDGLISVPTVNEAISLMKRTQSALREKGNLRLHKVASNSEDVMSAFPTDDIARDLKDLDFSNDPLPLQHSLGMGWDLERDAFTFRVSSVDRPFTRRGVLSVINGIFDPLGFAAPVIIKGKLLLRELMNGNSGWDDTLPTELEPEWELWKESLQLLQDVQIRRTYLNAPASLRESVRKELHVYCDASEQAIAAVAYFKAISPDNEQHCGFALGKAKVAPTHGHSVPRLELCGAVLAIEVYEKVSEALGVTFESVCFYTDSKVVLGYIHNEKRRFYMYVSNRVERIRKSSTPAQWFYIPTDKNPADCATRSVKAKDLQNSPWLLGPRYLQECPNKGSPNIDMFPIVDPDQDKELRPYVQVLKSDIVPKEGLGSHRFERFSSWNSLVTAIALLTHVSASCCSKGNCKGWHRCPEARTVESYQSAERWIILTVQREAFATECTALLNNKSLPRGSPILNLDPFIDDNGMLSVGGRLRRSQITSQEKFPLIIPKGHHIALLLARHYHQEVKHQGRTFTEGAIRMAGYWIVGGKRLVSSMIRKCVKCLKLRGREESQKMSDLPESRLDPAPPFTYVGVDVFGPWTIVTRRTRGGQAHNKRWAVMFTCLVARAVHIEVIEDMSSSSFICALRRFISLRGPVKEFRSDRGSNFVASTRDLHIDSINVEDPPLKELLFNKASVWKFNPPHSSHMGGAWERMIGSTRKILDSMMSEIASNRLTHEVLTTFFAEVCAIINARPLVPVSADPDNPLILSPSTILTQKTASQVSPFDAFDPKDVIKSQWKRAQHLADVFWKRWKQEYIQSLQSRRKWQLDRPNLKNGDIVLLKEDSCRNDWKIARVENAIHGEDDRVRKAEVCVFKEGRLVNYTRPITEMVVLLRE